MRKVTGVCLLVLASIGTLAWASNGRRGEAPVRSPEVRRDRLSYTRLPLSFEVNEGQAKSPAKYLARGQGYTLLLAPGAAFLQLEVPRTAAQNGKVPAPSLGLLPAGPPLPSALNQAGEVSRISPFSSHPHASELLRLRLLGASLNAKITGEGRVSGYSSYFLGNDPKQWHTHIPNYAQVRYESVYPGIDLTYYGRQGQLENDFELSPGADAKLIRLEIGGVKALRVDEAGDLALKVKGGEVYLKRPRAYQGSGAARREVPVQYELRAGNQVGFKLGAYDHGQKLVIDPVLAYSTYLGGGGSETGFGIAVDPSGNAYVTGTTTSLNFPTTSTGQDSTGGGADAFVTKFNPAGSTLIYSVYLGGGADDTATDIVLDSSQNAYIVGYTYSTDFPTTSGAFQTTAAGNGDVFLTKLNSTGSALAYSTYLGGTATDYGYAVAVDAAGDAFVTGSTLSTDFPTMSPLQVGNDGYTDAFLSEFNPDGTALLYSTYLGGTGGDVGLALALDGSGNPYVTGYTTSPDFPTQNAYQSTRAGTSNAFISEINPETSSLVFSTYLGGSGSDVAYALALDSAESIYLAGSTTSNDFPVTGGAFQTSNHGQGDAFLVKLAPGAAKLVYSTLLGGSGADQAKGIALDSSGDVFMTGFTQSSDFPLSDALQRVLGIAGASTCGGSTLCSDAFVSEFGPSGNLLYSTFLGGNGADAGQAIAVDAAGAAYITGSTASANFPVIAGAVQSTYAASSPNPNAFAAKVSPQDAPAVALTPQKVNFGNQALNTQSTAQTVTLMNAGSAPLSITGISATGDFSQTNNCGSIVPAGGATCSVQVTFNPSQLGPTTDQINIADDAQGSPQRITVTGTGVTSSGGALTLTPDSLSFPAQTVGDTSASQAIQVVNTGTSPVTVTGISTSGDFAETDNCGPFPNVLNVGAACTVNITFTPKSSGNLTGSLTVQDDAANGPQGATLTGTGNAVFSLSANKRSTALVVGTASTTFTITAASSTTSFVGNIDLSCTSGTCTFNPSTIKVGESSTLTVSGLTASSANPTNISIKGTNGSQTATISVSVFLQDFSLSVTPPVTSVTAGLSATYMVTVTPLNGFNQVVLLGCKNLPQDTTCTYSPPGITMDGTSPVTATLSVNTTAETSAFGGPSPRGAPPPGTHPSIPWWAYLAVLLILSGGAGILISRRRPGRVPLRLRAAFAVLTMVGLLAAFVVACNQYSYGPTTAPAVNGTPANTYTITLVGTLGNNNSVQRTTTTNLVVEP